MENRADRKAKFQQLNSGKHTLKIHLLDPGVIVDWITIELGGLKQHIPPFPKQKLINTIKTVNACDEGVRHTQSCRCYKVVMVYLPKVWVF